MDGDDQSAIVIISSRETLPLAAAVVEAEKTEWALNISELIPESWIVSRSQRPMVAEETGLPGLI